MIVLMVKYSIEMQRFWCLVGQIRMAGVAISVVSINRWPVPNSVLRQRLTHL
jgi:hypothetical protein